jgi:hypothetical protein
VTLNHDNISSNPIEYVYEYGLYTITNIMPLLQDELVITDILTWSSSHHTHNIYTIPQHDTCNANAVIQTSRNLYSCKFDDSDSKLSDKLQTYWNRQLSNYRWNNTKYNFDIIFVHWLKSVHLNQVSILPVICL